MKKPSKSAPSETSSDFNILTEKIKVRLSGDRFLLLYINEITYFKAKGKHAYIHTTIEINKEEVVYHSLSHLERILPKSFFIRVGRCYLLNLTYIHKIDMPKGICTMRIDKNNSFEIKDLSARAIKAIIINNNIRISI